MNILFEGTERRIRYKKDPSRHYVLVARGGSSERDPVQDFLDAGYRIESEDKEVTGSSGLVLMSIEISIWEESERRRVQYNQSLLEQGQVAEVGDHDDALKEYGGGGHPRIEIKPPSEMDGMEIIEVDE